MMSTREEEPRLSNSKISRDTAEANYARTQKKAKDAAAAVSEHEAQARATDQKTARLKALRLARDAAVPVSEPSGKFKAPPRRKSQPAKKVAVSEEAKRQYEEAAGQRENQQRTYGVHLPADKK